nr:PREDICTED: uncharacterized protein LOC105678254 [Linepithema humile]
MAAEARELHVRLIRFYARLREQDKKWTNLLKQAEDPLESLDEKAEQYRHIRSLNLKEVQETIGEEAWRRLQHKIHMCMQKEVTRLLDIQMQLKNICQDMENHLKNLQDARSRVLVKDQWMQVLVNGTAHRPNLTNLLVWSMDAHQHYNNMCLRIDNCFDKLNYDVRDTIEDLTAVFVDERSGRKQMQHILAFTQFLAKEPPPPP